MQCQQTKFYSCNIYCNLHHSITTGHFVFVLFSYWLLLDHVSATVPDSPSPHLLCFNFFLFPSFSFCSNHGGLGQTLEIVMASSYNPVRGMASYRDRLDRLDCTLECRAVDHASVALCAAYLGNIKLLQHCITVCANPFCIQDSVGRNALHVAASCGHFQLVHWLISRVRVKINVHDLESKWTALHRSMYYGQLGVSALLLKVLLNGDRKSIYFLKIQLCL